MSSRNTNYFSRHRKWWMPGRKKHGRHGNHDHANKHGDYSSKQKPNAYWTVGGSKAQEELVKAGLSEKEGDFETASVLSTSCATITVALNLSDIQSEKESNRFAMLDTFDQEEQQEQNENFHDILPINDNKAKNANKQDDINSIEKIEEKRLNNDNLDADHLDGSLYNVSKSHKKKNKKKKKKQDKEHDEISVNHEDEDMVVKCLYYTMMCCECSIS